MRLSVQPEAGSALYWFNQDSSGSHDSRNYHMGCPVAIGNKWIANKWIKWSEQMFTYPCYTDKRPYNFPLHAQMKYP